MCKQADGYINVIFDLHGVGLNNLDLGIVIGKPGIVVVLQVPFVCACVCVSFPPNHHNEWTEMRAP